MAKRNLKVLYVVREGTGRPSRSAADAMKANTPAQVKRLRDAALSGMADAEWGWEIGRLFLQSKITADQFEAGKRWRRILFAWRTAWGIPAASTKPLSLFLSPKSPPVDPDSPKGQAEAERAHSYLDTLRLAHGTLSAYGADVEATIRRVCEDDAAPVGEDDLNRLCCGLGALSSLWGLTAGDRKGRSSL